MCKSTKTPASPNVQRPLTSHRRLLSYRLFPDSVCTSRKEKSEKTSPAGSANSLLGLAVLFLKLSYLPGEDAKKKHTGSGPRGPVLGGIATAARVGFCLSAPDVERAEDSPFDATIRRYRGQKQSGGGWLNNSDSSGKTQEVSLLQCAVDFLRSYVRLPLLLIYR